MIAWSNGLLWHQWTLCVTPSRDLAKSLCTLFQKQKFILPEMFHMTWEVSKGVVSKVLLLRYELPLQQSLFLQEGFALLGQLPGEITEIMSNLQIYVQFTKISNNIKHLVYEVHITHQTTLVAPVANLCWVSSACFCRRKSTCFWSCVRHSGRYAEVICLGMSWV